jgi:hypothetical protein
MQAEHDCYDDGYHSARAGHGMLLGNPYRVLTVAWEFWRSGYIRGKQDD